MWICSNYRWLVPLRVARSLKPIVCRRLLARVGATGRGRCGFPCEPLAVSARPVSSDKLVAMAGFDEDDAWDMECSIDMEHECEPPADMEPPVNVEFSKPEDQAAREFEEFQRACVELPVNFEIGEDEVSSPDTRPKAAAVSADRLLPDSTRNRLVNAPRQWGQPHTARAAADARASLDPPTPLTFHVKRQRLRTKTGITSAQGSGYIAVRLRDSKSLAMYKAVVQQDRYKARKRVCQMMGRQLGKVRKGLALKLKTGKVLHCTSKEMYQANLTSLTSSILLEIVDTYKDPIIAGAAAQRWLIDQGHECLPIPKPKVPDREFVIKSTVAFVTWHGDFGASDVALVSKSASLDSLCEQVQSTQAVKKAYQKALSTLQDLQERFGLVDMAVGMEICTRTWAQEQVVKLHVHSWIVQACNREKLRQGDCVIPGATGLPHIQQSSGWKKRFEFMVWVLLYQLRQKGSCFWIQHEKAS